jgi:hypothetical protein
MIFDNTVMVLPVIDKLSNWHYSATDQWMYEKTTSSASTNNYCTIKLPKAVVEYELN